MDSAHRSAVYGFVVSMAATLALVLAIEFISASYQSAFWPVALTAAVVFSILLGGIEGGLAAAVISVFYAFYFLSARGFPAVLDYPLIILFAPLGIALLAILLLAAVLRQRSRKRVDDTRRQTEEEVDRRLRYYESTIQASEQRLRTLLEHSFDTVLIVDQKGAILYASPSVERLSGFKPEELEGHNGFEFIHPEDIAESKKKLAQILQKPGSTTSITYRLKHKTREWYWVEAGAVNLIDNPAVHGVLVNFRDITERREAETRILESEQKFRTLFENMDEGFALCEMIYDEQDRPIDFRYLDVNPSWERQTGLAKEKVVGKTVKEVIPTIEQFWIDTYAKVVQTGEPIEVENYVKELSRWFEVHASKQEGNRFAAVFIDISERRRGEESLRARTVELALEKIKVEEEKAKLDTIVSAIGDAVFAVDDSGKIILMNHTAEKMTGYQIEEALGKYYSTIFQLTSEQTPRVPYPDFVKEVIQTGKPRSLALHSLLIRRDGAEIPISDIAAPYRDENNRILGAVVVLRDSTTERALERAKDEFISVASHQLRTPLGSMRWTMEMMMQDSSINPELKKSMQQMYDNNRRMIALVNDLLNVSRIDQGRVPDQSRIINPEQIIKSVFEELKQMADLNQIQLNFFGPPQPPQIWFDPDRFREIIENLVSNALKYNRQGGKIDVSMEVQGNTVRLSVADNGIGIPESEQGRVFQKFFRAANAVQSETEGSGLGLFVVKSYVEKWGGSIWFESKEGEGTKFHVDLPLRSGETEERKV